MHLFMEADDLIEVSVQDCRMHNILGCWIRNILRLRLLKKFYKTEFALQLAETQWKARIIAFKAFLSKKAVSKYVWFSDESCFYADGIVQKRINTIGHCPGMLWRPLKHSWRQLKWWFRQLFRKKGLIIIGPYLFHKAAKIFLLIDNHIMNAYCGLLRNWNGGVCWRNYILCKTGAAPHTAISSKYALSDIFQDVLIGKMFSIIWLPYSPDLTPIDFWLWPKLKAIIFSKRHKPLTSVRGLKLAIMHAFRRLQSENFDHVVPSLLRRMSSCFAKNGYRR